MRPVLIGDVTAAARVLLLLPEAGRAVAALRLCREAEAADLHRARERRGHPHWGNGSLMAAAMARPQAPEPRADDSAYARCLVLVLEAIMVHSACPECAVAAVRIARTSSEAGENGGVSRAPPLSR